MAAPPTQSSSSPRRLARDLAHGLPWMGLGLASNLDARPAPDPWRLLDVDPTAFDYLEYSAPLSLEDARREAHGFGELERRRPELGALLHPVHLNLYGPALERPSALAALDAHARAVGSPWVSNDVAWWHVDGRVFPGHRYLAPPLTRTGLDDCAAHAVHVQAALSVPLLLENPAFVAVRGAMHVLDFMAELHARTGCGLVLDLGHLLSHQLARDLAPDAGLEGFAWEAVVEIHVAGGVVTRRGGRRVYVDDHPLPVREEVFALLEAVRPRCAALRAVTLEGDGQPDPVAALALRRLRRDVPREPPAAATGGRAAAAPRARALAPDAAGARARGAQPPASPGDGAWRVFDETFGATRAQEDAIGASLEAEFRLAVLAELLDREWPRTRRLVAPDTAGLAAFAASGFFRAAYEGGGGSLGDRFGAYAAERVAPHVEPVFRFERDARAAASRARRRPPPAPGRAGLGPGVGLGEADVDLTELLYAAAALERHLAGRAQVSGRFDASGFDALHQVARRAPRARFPFAARWRSGAVEVLPLPPALAALLARAARGDPLVELERAAPAIAAWATREGWLAGG